MSKATVTDFSKRTGSPYQNKNKDDADGRVTSNDEEALKKSNKSTEKEKREELLEKINKKTAEIQSNKPKDGIFIEVVTHGAFTAPKSFITAENECKKSSKIEAKHAPIKNLTNGSKSLLGFPSSANDLALEAKTDLESDPNISKDVKEKVIEKLFMLVSMVQHLYESKVRISTDFEKYKEKTLRDELRLQKEHTEQLYKLNVNFQTEFVQAVQQIKSELDLCRQGNRSFEEVVNEDKIQDGTDGSASDFERISNSAGNGELAEKNEVI
ncbi:hypothetical protein EVAR_82788_1 [Eumeta japonica]|uniref:Uncharacterized protein n=1 Tax=Eumeta variegata TaxID=151549 RepID=A0A4C1UN41_EUMVA|nr:hypothetical protein EVAR_82788_1 [Eumeta japonica]